MVVDAAQRRLDEIDLYSLRSLTKVPSIGPMAYRPRPISVNPRRLSNGEPL